MKPLSQLTEGSSLFLDLVRAFSVQLVVIGHGISFCHILPSLQQPYFPYMQNIAVLLFFILSGYLISNSIFTKLGADPNYSFRAYFIDRFSRIYGAFVPALLLIIIIDQISISIAPAAYIHSEAFSLKSLFGNLLMLQDFPFLKHLHLKITSFGSARPLWTLAIEWWIYMWFGLLSIKIFRGKPSVLTLICFALLSVVPVYNLIGGRGSGLTLYWLFGALIGIVYEHYRKFPLSKSSKYGLLFSLLALACLRLGLTMKEYDPVFAFLLTGVIMVGMDLTSSIQPGKGAAAVIRLVANYSYTLYLIHYTIYDMLVNCFRDADPSVLFLTGFTLSNILALLAGYYTETKLTKWMKNGLRAKFA